MASLSPANAATSASLYAPLDQSPEVIAQKTDS